MLDSCLDFNFFSYSTLVAGEPQDSEKPTWAGQNKTDYKTQPQQKITLSNPKIEHKTKISIVTTLIHQSARSSIKSNKETIGNKWYILGGQKQLYSCNAHQLINNNIRISYFSSTHNCKPTFAILQFVKEQNNSPYSQIILLSSQKYQESYNKILELKQDARPAF